MAFSNDDISINSLIGTDSFIEGNLKISGQIRIDGDINGNIECTGNIMVGEKARIRGNITAKSAIIGGIVEGDVFAPESIQLFSTASVLGDVISKAVQLADGVLFDGYCIALKDETSFEKARTDWLDRKVIDQRLANAEH